MRARLALLATAQSVELREIVLKNKPAAMLEISPKGTVPVLRLNDGTVIEESLDIMKWAVEHGASENLNTPSAADLKLIDRNDEEFKYWLDRYKYHVGHPEHPPEYYRQKALTFVIELDALLEQHHPDLGLSESGPFLDFAIFPFVRQFALVDKDWFDRQTFGFVHQWFSYWSGSAIFSVAMKKYSVWSATGKGVIFAAVRPS